MSHEHKRTVIGGRTYPMIHNADNWLTGYGVRSTMDINDWDETYPKSLPDSIRESTRLLSDVDSKLIYLPLSRDDPIIDSDLQCAQTDKHQQIANPATNWLD